MALGNVGRWGSGLKGTCGVGGGDCQRGGTAGDQQNGVGSWGKYSGHCLSPLSPHRRTPARRGASQSLALGRQKLTALDRCGELSRVRHLFHISLARRREPPHHEKQSIFHPEHKTYGNVPFKFLSASITPKSHSKNIWPIYPHPSLAPFPPTFCSLPVSQLSGRSGPFL